MSAFGQRRVARAFGKVLRAVRHEAGVSQELLAERADMDRTIAIALRMEPATLFTVTMARLRGDPP
jgi:transcriptional regulator with XRE-family HTH domain